MATLQPVTRRWTRAEYYRLAELGLFQDQRVELIEGEVVEMPAQRNLHAVAIGLTEPVLRKAFGTGYWVRCQMPLHLTGSSAPEPDLAVVAGMPRDFRDHPNTALLVVEISDSSLAFDRVRKAALYARAGIQDYWILNLVERQLEIRRIPEKNAAGRGCTYADTMLLGASEFARPLAAKSRVAVADLLP